MGQPVKDGGHRSQLPRCRNKMMIREVSQGARRLHLVFYDLANRSRAHALCICVGDFLLTPRQH